MKSAVPSRKRPPSGAGNWQVTAFGVAVVAVFLLAAALEIYWDRQTARYQAEVNSANLARAFEEHVIATIRSIDQLLLNIARDYRHDPAAFDLKYWVDNSELILRPAASVLAIANRRGVVVLSNIPGTDHDIGGRKQFIVHRDRAVAGLFISKPVTAAGSGRTTIEFTRRLDNPDGTFAGVAVYGLDPDYFASFYSTISVGKAGAISLIGTDGIIRARITPDGRRVGQAVAGTELFAHLARAPMGSFMSTYASDHIERITSYRRVDGYPLIVAIGLATDDVLQAWRKFRDQVLLGAFALSVLVLATAVLLSREMTRRQDSDRLLASVLDAAPATIQLKDADLRIRWVNRAYLAVLPRPIGSLVGKRDTDILADTALAAAAEAADREVLRTGHPIADIAQHYPADAVSPERHMLVTKTPIFGAGGEVVQILTIGTDVTALTRAETAAAAAREAERTVEAAREEVGRLLAGLPTAVYRGVVDPDGHITIEYSSDNVAAITGRPVREIVGNPGWYKHLGDASRSQVQAFSRRVLAVGEAQTDYRLPGPDAIWIRDRARVARRHAAGTDIIGNWTDITREHAMTQQVMENAKLATLGELATGLAHELNQPIAVMSLAAENADDSLAEGEAGIADARARLGRIVEQARRAKNIVSHLRIFGRTDAGPLEPVRLDDAVTGGLALIGSLLRNEDIQVHTDLPPELPLVLGRLVLIEHVIVNLCMNARDAMRTVPADRRILRIEASAWPRDRVELRVIDQGAGIRADVMPRLFEPFFTTKPAAEGTGLGLSISHGMMLSMGGSLSAANTGSGACFALSLRASRARRSRQLSL